MDKLPENWVDRDPSHLKKARTKYTKAVLGHVAGQQQIELPGLVVATEAELSTAQTRYEFETAQRGFRHLQANLTRAHASVASTDPAFVTNQGKRTCGYVLNHEFNERWAVYNPVLVGVGADPYSRRAPDGAIPAPRSAAHYMDEQLDELLQTHTAWESPQHIAQVASRAILYTLHSQLERDVNILAESLALIDR